MRRSKMSDEELSEEEKQKLEEEKAKAWLFGQDYARARLDKVAYDEAQKRYKAKAEAKELAEIMENTERGMRDANKKFRKERNELRRAKKESKRA